MGKVKTINRAPIYRDEEEELEYTFEPVEDTITVEKVAGGYEARYLVRDDDAESPEAWRDDSIFLVHYHRRDFYVANDKIITENDLKNWYRKEYDDYVDIQTCETCGGKGILDEGLPEERECEECEGKGDIEVILDHIPQEDEYWIFPVAAYIHSGVSLSLGSGSHYPDQRWDVSHVGAVLVKKGDDWSTEEKAYEAAERLIEQWNQYLSGDVYGIVKETYDEEKNQVDQENCWGFYGYKYAMEALKTEI